jgi:uncharacterized membrane protein
MKNSPGFEIFLYFILIVKILFVISLILSFYAKNHGTQSEEERYNTMKIKFHNLFTLCMGILLLIVFNPRNNPGEVCVSGHTKVFLFLFGFLSIISILELLK